MANVNRSTREKQAEVDKTWLKENLAPANQYRMRKRRKMRPEVKAWGKRDTGVFMQMASGHALIKTYLKRIGKEETEEGRWCGSGGRETRGHLFGKCEKWKEDRLKLYQRLRKDCKLKGKIHWSVKKMFQEERATAAVMAFLKDTMIGYKVP